MCVIGFGHISYILDIVPALWQIRLATATASSVLCCIIDGMDQSKFRCPRLTTRPSKNVEVLYRPTLHCSGVLIHGHSFSFHVANEDVKKDSVTQAELLFLNLSSLLETHAKLPLILHLQQDNCYREGKNQYVCAAMILLVVLGVFRATCLGFLGTGHSESDIFESWLFLFVMRTLKGNPTKRFFGGELFQLEVMKT